VDTHQHLPTRPSSAEVTRRLLLPLLSCRAKFTITTHLLDTDSTIAWFGAAVRYSFSLLEPSSRVSCPSAIHVAEQPPPEQPDRLRGGGHR
jgi:hypothetical protein